MRAFLVLLCAVVSAGAADLYVRSTESVGFGAGLYGGSYSQPNGLALNIATLFGLFAIALAIEGSMLALRNRLQASAPQPQTALMSQAENNNQGVAK